MTTLSLAVRNYLAQDPALTPLLGKSASWDTWIFEENPVNVKVENTSKALIVVVEESPHTTPNEHNTLEFPRILIDIWADPTRNPNGSILVDDAKDKIIAIGRQVKKNLHLIDPSDENGMPIVWGTAEEVATRTGAVIAASRMIDGPDFSPVRDSEGTLMGRYTYAVNQIA